MDAALKKILKQMAAFWKSISKKLKILIIGGLVGAVVLITVVSLVLSSTKYELLYSGLGDSESGKIVSELASKGYKYKLSGSSIYVDAKKADQARMELAVDGYPQSTLTYSTYMSGTSWAMTDSDKQRLALYQIQDRLQDTIKTIPGVKAAEVTIGQSDNTTYVLSSDKVPVTASVKLTLDPGVTLTKKQVEGIVLIVSRSVSNLSKDNVSVMDSDGNPLTDSNSASDDSASHLTLKSQVENEVKQKVLSVLNSVYGSGNVQVAAGATLDFTQKTTSTTTYSGTNNGQGIPSSVSQSSTVTSGATTSATTTQTSGQTNYLVNTVNEQIQDQGGTLKNLTIAVLLNNNNTAAASANIDQVKQTVAYAVGLTDTNGVSVQLSSFASGNKTTTSAAQAKASTVNTFMFAALGGLALIILLSTGFTMIFMGKRRKRKKALLKAEDNTQPVVAGSGNEPPIQPGKSLEEAVEEVASQNTLKKQISDFADKKPELVAQMLRNWLKD